MTDYYGRQSLVTATERHRDRGTERDTHTERQSERETVRQTDRERRPISQLHSDVKMTDNAGAAGPLTGFIGP